MGQVQATINGRSYQLNCADGQEQRLSELAKFVGKKVDELAKEFGQVGDIRLLLMAALMTADELFDLREDAARRAEAAPAPREAPSSVIEKNLTMLKHSVSALPL
jgi:cell division protein ZapA